MIDAILSGLTAPQTGVVTKIYCRDLAMEPEYCEELDGWRAALLKARG